MTYQPSSDFMESHQIQNTSRFHRLDKNQCKKIVGKNITFFFNIPVQLEHFKRIASLHSPYETVENKQKSDFRVLSIIYSFQNIRIFYMQSDRWCIFYYFIVIYTIQRSISIHRQGRREDYFRCIRFNGTIKYFKRIP